MKILRFRYAKIVVLIVFCINLVFFYYTWKSKTILWRNLAKSLTISGQPNEQQQNQLGNGGGGVKSAKDKLKNANRHIRKSITIIFTGYYNFENDLKASIDSILNVIPNMPILVLQDGMGEAAYPPINYERNLTNGEEQTVNFMSLAFDIQKTHDALNPLNAIRTKYALLMPDGVRLNSKNLLQKILREINTVLVTAANGLVDAAAEHSKVQQTVSRITVAPDEIVRRLIISPFAGNLKSYSSCTRISLDLPNWTVEYVATNISSLNCDLFLQKHAILVDVGVLKELPDPFALPFPEMFYIQAKIANISKTVLPQTFQEGRRLFASFHAKQRRMDLRRRQFRDMYKKLQIKRIIKRAYKVNAAKTAAASNAASQHEHNLVLEPQFSSSNFSLQQVTEIDLIGCERTTKSCIGSVYDNRPFYIYMGRHTPPCCLDKLKTTFHHVLEEFENVGIRYWLDNFALKSAIETNQVSPDAYDIDISFNVQDLERSNAMKKSQNKPYVDNEGFYWIKATDGHYFRVQFSKINQIGINLLPYEITGNEVHANAFFGWKAVAFSADFLHPMSTVFFMGKNVMCPNNVPEYLDYKKIKVKTNEVDVSEE